MMPFPSASPTFTQRSSQTTQQTEMALKSTSDKMKPADVVVPSEVLRDMLPLANHAIPEFLYQLMKMVTNENSTVIEWSDGSIMVHDPTKLASEVLSKYFRHSKYSSFQRQLNYFGFCKIGGKGKMAPCRYVNKALTKDISSLLYVKRKNTTTKNKRKILASTLNISEKPGRGKCFKGNTPIEIEEKKLPLNQSEVTAGESANGNLSADRSLGESTLTPVVSADCVKSLHIPTEKKHQLWDDDYYLSNMSFLEGFTFQQKYDFKSKTNIVDLSSVNDKGTGTNDLLKKKMVLDSIGISPASSSHKVEENVDCFDAADFCATLNDIIRKKSCFSATTADGVGATDDNNHHLEPTTCTKQNAPHFTNTNADLRQASNKDLNENPLINFMMKPTLPQFPSLELSLEPTPISEMEHDLSDFYETGINF